MHFRLEAAQGELRSKGRQLVKAIADRLVEEDTELAKALRGLVVPIKAYVTIPIPAHLALDWPADGRVGEDSTPPHFTVLYIGEIEPLRRNAVLTAVQAAIEDVPGFSAQLSRGVSWFTSHEGKEIAHKGLVAGAAELRWLHERVRGAAAGAGCAIKHAGREFKPHSTLGYLDARDYPQSWPIPEGSFVVDSIDVGFSDGDCRRFMLADPLSKNDSDASYNIAAGSQMGARAVGPGGSGPNIASFSPVQLKPQTSERMRERVTGQVRTDEELAFARHAMDVRKEGMKLIWNTPDATKVFELPQPTHRSDTAQNALDEAPAQKLRLEDNADRLRAGSAESAPNHMGQKPVGPALMLPASYTKCELPADATPSAAPTLGMSAAAPKPRSVSLSGPLGVGGTHTVKKRGIGEVTLGRTEVGYTVAMDGFDPVEFASLSAACDHVWVRTKGYEDAASYKAALGVNKVPSGAGWKFWGLKRKRAA